MALAAASLLALAGAQAPAPERPPSTEARDAERLVSQRCLGCHAAAMVTQQRLTAKQWTANLEKMRRWGAVLSDAELALLARHLAGRFGPDAPAELVATVAAGDAAAALAALPDGPFGGGDPAAGRALHAARCAHCHGQEARGGTPGVNLADRPLLHRAPEFAAAVRGGRGLMPPQPLADDEIAALLAYLRTLR